MSDGRFFTTTKKGEIYELKEELNSLDKGKKKDAVKKVIAAMTVGKDVSSLFPDVVNCMQTENLELKKLVYLYLINYAKSQPDLAIMAVNTFVKDSQDPNPLIRALAVRTMGCIRVEKITEYLCDPLTTCLMDDDPYVRKTAAICVAKLHDISPDIVEDRGFLDTLRDMLGDSNPMVVANAVAALAEIDSSSAKSKFKITSQTLYKLLAALNECTEWGQVFILDSLAKYDARDTRDAESIIERVTPRLQHANCAVVLSAVKVILKQMDILTNTEMTRTLCKKMAPPLVTILSSEPEIQYVALRNINLIIQKRPNILANDIKVFFCKYNDPIYVKMEKLEVMIKLASERNIDQVLLEFKEYATEVDVDFVRKAVRAIGRCAISLEKSVESCINVLTELIHTKVNYVVQEAICVIKDVFRKYPNTYEKIIATLCENLDTLDEPEAKASMIWIIGEYAERIDNADELLETFLETFLEENTAVQLQLLTATVKLFLKRPNENVQGMIQAVLHQATQETDNPDLRDRAYIYWRLLSTDPEAAKDVVLADKPTISDDANVLEDALLNELLVNIGTLASVYHKPAESFVSITRVEPSEELEEGNEEDEATDAGPSESAAAPVAQVTDLMGDLMGGDPQPAPTPAAPAVPTPAAPAADPLSDLLGLDMGAPAAPAPTPAAPAGAAADPFGMMGLDVAAAPAPPTQNILLQAAQAQGLEIKGIIAREGADLVYLLTFSNSGAMPLDGFQIQFNKNSFGLTPGAPLQLPAVAPGGSATTRLPLLTTGAVAPGPTSPQLQIAIKNRQHQQVWYFADSIPVEAMFLPDGRVDRDTFLKTWRQLPDSNESSKMFQATITNVDALTPKLEATNVFFMAQRVLPGTNSTAIYACAKVAPSTQILIEFTSTLGTPGVKCCIKTANPDVAAATFGALEKLVS